MGKYLQIALCEDSDADASLLQGYVEQGGIPLRCERFKSGEALLRSFHPERYDLVFMDICMKGMRGIEIVEEIRKTDENVVIAFTTSSPDYTRESYRLGALKYLDKPVKAKDVKEALELALLKRRSRAYVKLLISGKHRDIPLDSIHYFEQCDHIVKIHMSGGFLQTSQTVRMNSIEIELPSPPFYRCHHSFIVNLG